MKRKKTKNLVQPEIIENLVELRRIKFLHFIHILFLEIDKETDAKKRRQIFRKVLTSVLEIYSTIAVLTARRKSQDIVHYFKISEKAQVELDYDLDEGLNGILELFGEAHDQVRSSENFMKPVVYMLLCMYIALAESDKQGANMCKNLAKELPKKWEKNTAKQVAADYLAKGEKNQERIAEMIECYEF